MRIWEQVRIVTGAEQIAVSAPYCPEWPEKARAIGGKWDSARSLWKFDARDEARVRDLCVEVFGTDGHPVEVRDIRVALDGLPSLGDSLWVGGRLVCRRRNRDWKVELGDGVVSVSGDFPRSGGSSKHPRLDPMPGTVLEVRDVPLSIAEALVAAEPRAYSFVERPAEPGKPDIEDGPLAAFSTSELLDELKRRGISEIVT